MDKVFGKNGTETPEPVKAKGSDYTIMVEDDPLSTLLGAFDGLKKAECERFKTFLSHKSYQNMQPIPIGRLEHKCVDNIATCMIKHYGEDKAVEVAKDILKDMNFQGKVRQLEPCMGSTEVDELERAPLVPGGTDTDTPDSAPQNIFPDDGPTIQEQPASQSTQLVPGGNKATETEGSPTRPLLLTVFCNCGPVPKSFGSYLHRALLCYYIFLLIIGFAFIALGSYILKVFPFLGEKRVGFVIFGAFGLLLPALGLCGICRKIKWLLYMILPMKIIGIICLIVLASVLSTIVQEKKDIQISLQKAGSLKKTDSQLYVKYLDTFQTRHMCCGFIHGSKDWGNDPPKSCFHIRLSTTTYTKTCRKMMAYEQHAYEAACAVCIILVLFMIWGFFFTVRYLFHLKASRGGHCCGAMMSRSKSS